MTTETLELPRVAHIVAELEDYTDTFDIRELTIHPWVSPTGRRQKRTWRRGRAMSATLAIATVTIGLLLGTACATTGATYRSGVGDSFPDAPPYYAGARPEEIARVGATIGHLPIAYQPGASQQAIFDPRDGSGSAVDVLLEEMNAYLDSLHVSLRIAEGRRVSAVAHAATAVPPDVRFGCETVGNATDGDCVERDAAFGRGRLPMKLSVGRPSPEWVEWTRELMDKTGVSRTLVITLEVGQYLTRQRGWRGSKEVELGTGNVAKLPWLTALDTPVSVLQFTGALVDRDGKAVRIGAEGFYAHRTRLAVSAVGGQELITDDDLREARTTRRNDLPGAPIAWRVALRKLVTELGAAEVEG